MSSPSWKLDGLWGKDVKSAARHFVLPFAAGVAYAAYTDLQEMGLSGLLASGVGGAMHLALKALWVALIAAVGRLIQRWMSDLSKVAEGAR